MGSAEDIPAAVGQLFESQAYLCFHLFRFPKGKHFLVVHSAPERDVFPVFFFELTRIHGQWLYGVENVNAYVDQVADYRFYIAADVCGYFYIGVCLFIFAKQIPVAGFNKLPKQCWRYQHPVLNADVVPGQDQVAAHFDQFQTCLQVEIHDQVHQLSGKVLVDQEVL